MWHFFLLVPVARFRLCESSPTKWRTSKPRSAPWRPWLDKASRTKGWSSARVGSSWSSQCRPHWGSLVSWSGVPAPKVGLRRPRRRSISNLSDFWIIIVLLDSDLPRSRLPSNTSTWRPKTRRSWTGSTWRPALSGIAWWWWWWWSRPGAWRGPAWGAGRASSKNGKGKLFIFKR